MAQLNFEHVSTNHQDQTVVVRINGKMYVYEFTDAFPCFLRVYDNLRARGYNGRALGALKQYSSNVKGPFNG